MNTLPMDNAENKEDDNSSKKNLLVKDLLPYGADIPTSPQFDPDLHEKWIDALFDEKSPLNKVVIATQKQEPGNPKTDKKS